MVPGSTHTKINAMKKRTWVQHVVDTSHAMDLPEGIFTHSAKTIAQELKAAVVASDRTKGTKFQSAMSMLNYYINRAGQHLAPAERARLGQAKVELRKLFGKPPKPTGRTNKSNR
jgi:hypothetical protein